MDVDDDNDSDAGDTSDDDLFFKRLEQKIHNGDDGKQRCPKKVLGFKTDWENESNTRLSSQ